MSVFDKCCCKCDVEVVAEKYIKFYPKVLFKGKFPAKLRKYLQIERLEITVGYVYFFLKYSFLMDQRNSLQMFVESVDVSGTRSNLDSKANAEKKT